MHNLVTHRQWKCVCHLILFAVIILLLAPYAEAAEPKSQTSATPPESSNKVASDPVLNQATLATQLALEAEKQQSPTLYLAAIELMSNLTQSSRKSTAVLEKEPATTTSKKASLQLDIHQWGDKAREYAKGDKALLSLVENRLENYSSREGLTAAYGKTKPEIQIQGKTFKVLATETLDPGQTLIMQKVIFEGGKPAIAGVIGDGAGDLDLWVYDGNSGGLIGSDTDNTSVCKVQWITKFEGPFTIRVKNVGKLAEQFIVIANW
jgi:hypothetical protein